ncbi:MAG: hypothetical protein EA405_05480 [Rhodospirillales bacterium]|nr:MAG: hypothetical protein EA405_05480 [Rhodospirillales bacterium]
MLALMWVMVFTVSAVLADTNPAWSAETAETAPSIRVRTGEHPGFSRIVFDWHERVDYALWREGARARVMFSSPARFDLGRLGAVPARRIRAVNQEPWLNGSAVLLTIPENATLSHMRVGHRVVVDVWSPRSRPRQAEADSDPPRDHEVEADAEPDAGPAERAEPERPSIPASDDASEASAPVVPLVPEEESIEEAEPDATPPADSAADSQTDRPGERPADRTGAAAPKPYSAAPDSTALGAVPVSPTAERQPPPVPEVPEAQEVPQPGGELRLDWAEPVAGAAFRRGPWVWLVFDRASEPDVTQLRRTLGESVEELHQIAGDTATVLRLKATVPSAPQVRRDGAAWLIRVVPEADAAPPRRALEPVVDTGSPAGPRLLLPVDNPGEPIPLTDPEVGDNFLVVALTPPGIGLARTWQYPELDLSETAQGIVVRPKVDDLRVATTPRGVVITRPDGLNLTPVTEAERRRAQLMHEDDLSRVFDPASWPDVLSGDRLADRRTRLKTATMIENTDQRVAALLKLAQFELAHGLAAESLGPLELAASGHPDAGRDVRLPMLRGMARAAMGRYDEAENELAHQGLADSDEAALWQAAVRAWRGDLVGAAPDLIRTQGIAQSYPRPLRIPLAAALVEAAIADDRLADAENGFALLAADLVDQADAAPMLAYLQGRLHGLRGEVDDALAALDRAAVGRDRLYRAKALWAATDLRLARGDITADAAVEALEGVRYAWRDDPLEPRLLRRFAELYGATGDHRARLVALRQAATRLGGKPAAAEIAAEMRNLFTGLFLDGDADAMSPLAAIALFDEFRELTPQDERGNEMIRRLADRLVSVDLLERAAELLEDQVRNRLSGVERARVGTRLGLVYVLERRAADALAALDASAAPGLPDDLARQRRHIRARALADLDRFDDALALLTADDSVDAERIRIEVGWRRQDWSATAGALGRLAEALGVSPRDALSEAEAHLVLNRAIALTLAHEDAGLAALQDRHGDAMMGSPYREAFQLLVSGVEGPPGDVRAHLDTTVGSATGFQAFLSTWRDRVRDDGLSTIN